MARRVIFLDIDGVLTTHQEYAEITGESSLPRFREEAVRLLRELVVRHNAEIVVSSAWRNFPNWEVTIRRSLAEAGWWKDPRPPIIGKTPDLYMARRGVEIESWLRGNPPGSIDYAILDDDPDFQPHQMPRFVRCAFENGLTQAEAEAVDRIFNTRFEAQRV